MDAALKKSLQKHIVNQLVTIWCVAMRICLSSRVVSDLKVAKAERLREQLSEAYEYSANVACSEIWGGGRAPLLCSGEG